MERAVLNQLKTILLPNNTPTDRSAEPTHHLTMAPYDPKTPGTPQSLDGIGLKFNPPYQDTDGFSDIVAAVIWDALK